MAFSFINGIQLGGDASTVPHYAYGPRQLRRMLWLWSTKVIGWVAHDFSGANWNTAHLATLTDGATHASDPTSFSSATGGFTTAMVGSFLLIHPTAAPASAGGFSDTTKNGFYRIKQVYSTNTIGVETWNGVHTDGLPLSQTGLNFTVYDFRTVATAPVDTNFAVMRGTGIGGTFDIRFREDYSANYGPTRVTASPFADWDAGTNAFSPTTRVTAETQQNFAPFADIAWVWAIGDLTHMIVWVRFFNTAFTAQDSAFMYLGDITAFHPASDLRPVVATHGALGGGLDEFTAFSQNIRTLGADDTTQVTQRACYLTREPAGAAAWHAGTQETRSMHSLRFVRSPILVANTVAGQQEMRGYLKNFDHSHFYGPRGPVPIGATRDRIRFFTQCTAPWNGSRIERYVY